MGLISKSVIMRWNGSNRKWYESKGYKWTKNLGEFEVKVEDLPNGSNIQIYCTCDNCEKIFKTSWQSYLRSSHDNKHYCRKCILKLFTNTKSIKIKLSKTKSFEQWCIENNRHDVLKRWDYYLNDCLPNEVTYSSNKKYWFKCNKYKEHGSELKNINNFTSGSNGVMNCNQCNSFSQWGIDNFGEDFLEKYWSKKNTINPWDISYSSNKKIWIKCQEKDYHEDYKISCSNFINNNRCPYCNNTKIHPKDSLGQYIVDNYGKRFLDKIWSDKNKKSPFEYAPISNQKVWWKCLDDRHEDYKRKIGDSHYAEFRCPKCVQERRESFLQEKARLYLEETNYTILHERDCTILPQNPKTNFQLPFDNEIKELKLICEVNGEQHYKITGFHIHKAKHKNTTPEQEFHYQQLKDRYKRIKAIQQGYYYLEIPYWTDDKDETWKTLIDNKIKEILSKKEAIN